MLVRRLLFLTVIIHYCSFSTWAHNPTWTDGIACIIYSHCTGCHNQNGIAPFSLVSYEEVYENRFSIAASIQALSMPPFPASQERTKFAHSNTLSDHEINEIVDWVNNFAPYGDVSNSPTPPTYSTGYQLQSPDFIGQIPAYTITSGNDVYRMFVIPVNNSTQRTIQSIEVYPGNRNIVHHALVFQDTSTTPLQLDQADPLPGYDAFGGTGSPTSKLITAYTPGQSAFHFAPGFGAILLPNSYLVVQMHYPGGVAGEVDSTQVRLKFGPANLRNVSTVAALNHNTSLINGPLFIPANTVKTFYGQVNNNINRTLTGIMPHMHLIGRSIKAFCVTPTNDTLHLIDIPEWDFHWQYFYQFQKPILLPAGSVLYGQATYDNTINNPNNPNNPPKDVSRGEGTEDEMFLIYMNLSSFLPTDTSIIIDTSSHFSHNSSCFSTSNLSESPTVEVSAFPNPVTSELIIKGLDQFYSVTLYDNKGKVVLHKACTVAEPLKMDHLANGIYYVQIITASKQVYYKKVLKE